MNNLIKISSQRLFIQAHCAILCYTISKQLRLLNRKGSNVSHSSNFLSIQSKVYPCKLFQLQLNSSIYFILFDASVVFYFTFPSILTSVSAIFIARPPWIYSLSLAQSRPVVPMAWPTIQLLHPCGCPEEEPSHKQQFGWCDKYSGAAGGGMRGEFPPPQFWAVTTPLSF